MADVDSKNPAELAADAATDVQRLAAILTHSGASPDALAGLHRIVAVLNGIHQQLAAAPLPGQQPAPSAPQQPAQPVAAPAAPQAAAPAAPPAPPQHQRAALHAATSHLQAAMASAKAAKQHLQS